MPAYYLRNMTASVSRTMNEHQRTGRRIAVLPLGATEQHGPHLPFETDTIIVEGIVEAVKEKLAGGSLDVEFLPAEPIGYSIEHSDAEGTMSLTFSGAIERWTGIAHRCQREGAGKFVMLNAHGGNAPLMTVVATELRVRHRMLAVATSWTRFALPDGLIDMNEKAFGIHGGDIETSVMLALAPDLVDMDKAKDFGSLQQALARDNAHLRAYGPHAFGWMMRDLNPEGVAGNAAAATAQKGRALIANAASGFIQLLEEVDRFEPPWW